MSYSAVDNLVIWNIMPLVTLSSQRER